MKQFVIINILICVCATAIHAAAGFEIIPCNIGNRWEYDSAKIVKGAIVFRGKSLARLDDASSGSSVYQVVSRDDNGQFNYSETNELFSINGIITTDRFNAKLIKGDNGLQIASSVKETSGERTPDRQSYNPPLMYFSSRAVNGKPWNVGIMRDGNIGSKTDAQMKGRETVVVPAGEFKDCIRVVYSTNEVSGTLDVWGKTFKITEGKSRGIYWIAEGVGVVKELLVSVTKAQSPGPDGSPITLEGASCTLNELKPGWVVK